MDFANLKSLTIPEGEVVSITVGGVEIWKSGYTNLVPLSTEADGVTIYNGGLGYKDGYRIRSGGAEAQSPNITITGFIPIKNGETLRIYPPFTGGNTNNTINFYNGSFENLGQITDSGIGYGICANKVGLYKTNVIDGVSTFTLTNEHDAAIAYVRVGNAFGAYYNSPITTGADMIITIDEEIEL